MRFLLRPLLFFVYIGFSEGVDVYLRKTEVVKSMLKP